MRNNLDLLVGIHNLFLQRYHGHSCSFVWCEIESLCIKRVSVTSVFLFRYTSFFLPESIIMQLLSFPSIFCAETPRVLSFDRSGSHFG